MQPATQTRSQPAAGCWLNLAAVRQSELIPIACASRTLASAENDITKIAASSRNGAAQPLRRPVAALAGQLALVRGKKRSQATALQSGCAAASFRTWRGCR